MTGRSALRPLVYIIVVLTGPFGLVASDHAVAESMTAPPFSDSAVTTESNCNFGMEKGEASQSCDVPIPSGCAVASFPGTTKPWTNISKGGNISCRFDEKVTDWKTRITGTCGQCKTEHCSAQFSVKFDCSQR